VTTLLEHLDEHRAGSRKLLVPYVMAGLPQRDSFFDVLASVSRHADAIEVGLPYSDPLMDGPVIAAAGARAIADGVGPLEALDLVGEASGPPRVAMTYYNPIHHLGEAEFCRRAAKSGVSGLIVPDLPLEESATLRAAAAEEGLAWIPLVAPTSSVRRVEAIAASATGFVYAVSTLGVTGIREAVASGAALVVGACKAASDLPVLVGIGISTPDHAVEASEVADGVVIGSALVRRILEEPDEVTPFLSSVRAALDRS
jgi:tryptophan synthase alpha chain